MSSQKEKKDKAPHILIMRLSAMGDVAILPHVVKTLRKEFPDLAITILTRPAYHAFFRGIDRVNLLAPDFVKQHKGFLGLMRLCKDIVRLGVTHVADIHNVIRTKYLRRLLHLAGLNVAVIDKGREGKRALTRKYHKFMVQQKPSYERYREVIRELGFCIGEPEAPAHVRRPIPEEITLFAGEKRGRWVGIAPFAKHVGKIYPTTLSGELTGMLAQKYDKVFIFGGGTYEKEFADCIEERYDGVISVVGTLKLGHEMDLMSNLDVMVTMDSASMHIASLVGTPVVSVWGATHPFAGFYGFGQDPSNAVQLDMPCRPCSVYGNKQCIYNDYRCLHKISPLTIYDKVVGVVDAGED